MSFFNVLPTLFQIGICIYYYSKNRSTDGILLIIGSGIHLLTSFMYVAIPFIMQSNNLPVSNVSSIYQIVGGFNFIGTIAFLAGLFMLIQKMVAHKESTDNAPKW
ncbi:hypothetical protein QNI19_17285 [Cytophagaceae bacterium DM2B3-1]|uniref:Uncharacterized protein n=1 Tax=Xanthocytophaga flava TaxID=3048013 RepID=A0ABT7CLX4_9BACT|nr:hypothetical protein [Xanthocytophaga flavus]MDJ1494695.1 hypothetical protein [Xanthocytophaga flavus]